MSWTAVEMPQGVPMVKGKTSKKIRGAIALAMGCVSAAASPALHMQHDFAKERTKPAHRMSDLVHRKVKKAIARTPELLAVRTRLRILSSLWGSEQSWRMRRTFS